MMSKLGVFFRSKTVWTLVLLFAVQGLTAIQPQLHGTIATTVQVILSAIALYFPASEIHTAAVAGTVSGASIVEPQG